MLRNIKFRSPLRRKGRLKIFEMLLFKTLQSQCIMPKLTIAERVFLVEKYFETKSVVEVLTLFQMASTITRSDTLRLFPLGISERQSVPHATTRYQ